MSVRAWYPARTSFRRRRTSTGDRVSRSPIYTPSDTIPSVYPPRAVHKIYTTAHGVVIHHDERLDHPPSQFQSIKSSPSSSRRVVAFVHPHESECTHEHGASESTYERAPTIHARSIDQSNLPNRSRVVRIARVMMNHECTPARHHARTHARTISRPTRTRLSHARSRPPRAPTAHHTTTTVYDSMTVYDSRTGTRKRPKRPSRHRPGTRTRGGLCEP